MLEPMKKRLTKKITLQIEGPKENEQKAVNLLHDLGFSAVDTSTSLPWREAFSVYTDNEPGICLAGARQKNNLTQDALSKLTNVPRRHISEMENNRRPIGKGSAKKMGKVLGVDYRVFL